MLRATKGGKGVDGRVLVQTRGVGSPPPPKAKHHSDPGAKGLFNEFIFLVARFRSPTPPRDQCWGTCHRMVGASRTAAGAPATRCPGTRARASFLLTNPRRGRGPGATGRLSTAGTSHLGERGRCWVPRPAKWLFSVPGAFNGGHALARPNSPPPTPAREGKCPAHGPAPSLQQFENFRKITKFYSN